MFSRHIIISGLCAMAVFAAPVSYASDAQNLFVLSLKNHQFSPQVLTVPANTKIRLTIRNQDPTPAEFESNALNREKVVGPKAEVTVFIGPLKPGAYGYYDDFHKSTTTGTIEAK